MVTLDTLRRELAETRETIGLSVPSVWDIAALRQHWPAWGDARIKRELSERVGITFGRGCNVEVARADVLTIDRQIESEAESRRLGHAAKRSAPTTTTGDLTAERRRLVARGLGALPVGRD